MTKLEELSNEELADTLCLALLSSPLAEAFLDSKIDYEKFMTDFEDQQWRLKQAIDSYRGKQQ